MVCRQGIDSPLVGGSAQRRIERFHGFLTNSEGCGPPQPNRLAHAEKETGCIFKDADCFKPCRWFSGRASSQAKTNSPYQSRQLHRVARRPLEQLKSKKWRESEGSSSE